MIILIAILIVLFLALFMRGCYDGVRGGAGNPDCLTAEFKILLKESLDLPLQPPVINLSDIPKSLTYRKGCKYPKTLNANGQRKLCLELIQFLTVMEKSLDTILYVGSAPGQMHGYVSLLFPQVKFILIDPTDHNLFFGTQREFINDKYTLTDARTMYTHSNKILYLYDNGIISYSSVSPESTLSEYPINIYDIDEDIIKKLDRLINMEEIAEISKRNRELKYPERVEKVLKSGDYNFYIFQDIFDIPEAKYFANILKNINFAFISDIRSREENEINSDVFKNLVQQYVWTHILKPNVYKVKFRFTFQGSLDADSLNVIKDYEEYLDFNPVQEYRKGVMTYLPGEIFIQPWAPVSSTETRLIGNSDDLKKNNIIYNESEYNNKFFYYNTFLRPWVMHENEYINKEKFVDRCGDCALEIYILSKYKTLINPSFEVYDAIDTFNNITKYRFTSGIRKHGHFYHRITEHKYMDIYNR